MDKVTASEIRAWAKSAGKEVGERGRLKQELIDEYLAWKVEDSAESLSAWH